MLNHQTLLPEWVEQEAIILAWPDEQTDWAPWLADVRKTYHALIHAITHRGTGVILLIRQDQIEAAKSLLKDCSGIVMINANYNDTWCRDYGFLTCQSTSGMQPVEFRFNGWGNKFDASKDDQINQRVLQQLCQLPLISFPIVAEGGALEIDEQGHLLSTTLCLFNPERNGEMSLDTYKRNFKECLGAKQISVFLQGHLEGDDTDGHIDTLVRFTPNKGLVIQSCFNRQQDAHYAGLKALVEECRQALPDHEIYELPLPEVRNAAGERLPASYANFLINNQQILCPTYQQPEDQQALEIIRRAYPQHQIVEIDSLPLVQQFGSVHCISMQVPLNTLKPDVISLFEQGISLYEPS